MKKTGTSEYSWNWNEPNTGATNSSTLTVWPGGKLGMYEEYTDPGMGAYYWSATLGASIDENPLGMRLMYNSEAMSYEENEKSNALSVRCIKYHDVTRDSDGDGIPDLGEDVNMDGNMLNDDSDEDGIFNLMDVDDDGDGLTTLEEDINGDGDPTNDDSDADGIPDYLDDDDDDKDGVKSDVEDRNGDGNYENDDTDGDGIPDYLDDDDDGDGLLTIDEDSNKDGNPINDDYDLDGLPDYLDNTCGSCPSSTTDVEGNIYKVVQIGEQCWMAENLRDLPRIDHPDRYSGPRIWVRGFSPGNYETYDPFDPESIAAAKATEHYQKYGAMYSTTAVMNGEQPTDANPSDVQGLCPDGWFLPSFSDWEELADHLGGMDVAGGKMKDVESGLWADLHPGANNESGFSGLPAGWHNTSETLGDHPDLSHLAWFHSSSTSDPCGGDCGEIPVYMTLIHDSAWGIRGREMQLGRNVRCIAEPQAQSDLDGDGLPDLAEDLNLTGTWTMMIQTETG